jgi:diguanylate cyclase (GGDEF)-like protein
MNETQSESTSDYTLPHLGGGAAGPMVPVLAISDSRGLGEVVVLEPRRYLAGRGTETDILIVDGRVSRAHAIFYPDPSRRDASEPAWIVQDNGSRNGTFLNGNRIAGATPIQHGDKVTIGGSMLLFLLRTEQEVAADRQLRRLAMTDALTGLLNRGAMNVLFKREFDRAVRYRRPLSLMILDIDNFKRVNDTYGHPAGDLVLQRVARLLLAEVRAYDLAARYGGEEFCVLLPETDQTGAFSLAKRVVARIAASPIPLEEIQLAVTASLGVAALDHSIQNLDDLLRRADNALYEAKAAGKNRAVLASPEIPGLPA